MAYAIKAYETGAPDVFKYEDITLPALKDDEIQIQHTAIGLNFIDTYHRTGLYPVAEMPFTPGLEAAGVVTDIGNSVTTIKKGDRIAYGTGPLGGYATHRNIAADKIVKLPDDISDNNAAAIMLKGMTVEYLIRRTYSVKAGDTVLFHAISGGVGSLACQWLKDIGATVIGTCSTDEKEAIAKANGCDHVIRYDRDDVKKAVMDITDNKGVPVVYDSVGQATFDTSLNCLSPRGMMVSFGQSSGPIEAFNPAILAQKGSLFYTRPSLMNYTSTREDLENSANAVFYAIKRKAISVHIGQTYSLSDAAKAHQDLESRKTKGATLLIP